MNFDEIELPKSESCFQYSIYLGTLSCKTYSVKSSLGHEKKSNMLDYDLF